MTPRLALSGAAMLMAVAVALGAFGAHALKTRLSPDALALWQTAVNYHAWHALGLLGVGVLMAQRPQVEGLRATAALFVAGIVLFSGSLYALALGAPSRSGLVTPFGGAAFIAGWVTLAISVARSAALQRPADAGNLP
jgi:uncharacterized membrane protein YgdD (TMEM256/DUF423 family)